MFAVYTIGVIIQIIESSGLALICAGRAVAGIGVGFVSAVIILYSEYFGFCLERASNLSSQCRKFAHVKFAVPWSLDTNSALLLVC